MQNALKEVPARIKLLREQAGLPQAELARMTGLTQAQISAYEVGRSFPGLESAMALSTALGVTVAELIGEKEPISRPPRPPTKNEMALWVIRTIGIDGFALDRIQSALLEKPYKL